MTALLDLGTNVSYQWEFGDGTTASGRVVSHTYALEGNYPVKVTAVNSRNTLVASLLVGVLNTAPNTDAGADQVVLLGSEVSLTANANDPDNHEPLSYLWEQISGPTVNIIGAGTATASFIAPDEPATMIFQLTVSDAFGKSSTDTVIVEAKEFAAFQTNKIFIPMAFRP
jgi:PKD repeat protein